MVAAVARAASALSSAASTAVRALRSDSLRSVVVRTVKIASAATKAATVMARSVGSMRAGSNPPMLNRLNSIVVSATTSAWIWANNGGNRRQAHANGTKTRNASGRGLSGPMPAAMTMSITRICAADSPGREAGCGCPSKSARGTISSTADR